MPDAPDRIEGLAAALLVKERTWRSQSGKVFVNGLVLFLLLGFWHIVGTALFLPMVEMMRQLSEQT